MENNNYKSSGILLSTLLFLIFLVLKLIGKIDWSWWWVTAPLWIPFGIVIIFLIVLGIIVLFE
jgi:hypothetical protein